MIKDNKGITLISVLIMVIVIIILASIAIIGGTKNVEEARNSPKEQNLAMIKAAVNDISIKKATAGVFTPADVTLYGTVVSEMPEIASKIPDHLLEGWYVLEEHDLEKLGIEYANEIYAVNYDKNEVLVFSDYVEENEGSVFYANLNPSGGIVSFNVVKLAVGSFIGKLPTPTKAGYIFKGWYTEPDEANVRVDVHGKEIDNGKKITVTSKAEQQYTTYYAHWTNKAVAEINGEEYYDTLQHAVSSVATDNVSQKIRLLKDVTEQIIINNGQNITFDLQNFKISYTSNIGNDKYEYVIVNKRNLNNIKWNN